MPRHDDNQAALPFMPQGKERDAIEEQMRLQRNVERLLLNVGNGGRCQGCGQPVVWVTHKNSTRAPYDRDGTNHFATCPERERFKRGTDGQKT